VIIGVMAGCSQLVSGWVTRCGVMSDGVDDEVSLLSINR